MNAEKQGVNSPKRKRLPLSKLTTDPETFQFRELETTEDHVRGLADAINAGNVLDPMTVWMRGEDDYIVVDGHHRYAAYSRCGYSKPVPVILHECSEADAMLLALSENTKTKLPMTKTERDNAAWRLVCSDHGLSKAQTVKATAVSDGTVGKMRRTRKQLEDQGKDLPPTWWMAMQALKGLERPELTDDMVEQMIEARAKALDDKIGKELGRMGNIQWEALARVLERRLEHHNLNCLTDYLVDQGDEADEEEPVF
ncbi:ParB/RepB/Spo0J family partition protein [Roseovarius pacificus]|uniref:ParB/RepB/Spo0J family partition protein n=1 Tax=Roseovarius pacificus TaxID=337701 RepID=UPI002A18B498|nr:ParB/RepB/Spo0J family partition protein [Roseovarius pacificus]